MLLLLIMYLSPVFAASLYWYAQRTMPGSTAWETLGGAAQSRLALLRPTAAAFLFGAAVVALATGPGGGVAFLLGAMTSAIAAALVAATSEVSLARSGDLAAPSALPSWGDASALANSLAAVASGSIGALAWFFADPAGAIVLAAFASGASAAALFLAIVAASETGEAGRALPVATTASLHSHLPALAAAVMIAATAEPEALLPLGGLLSETETLRSELLLLPIAVCVLSPVVALLASPLLSMLSRRRGEASLYALERVAALLAGLAMAVVVWLSGLAPAVTAAFAVGLVARQVAVFADEARSPVRAVARPATHPVAPALVSAVALLAGNWLAGWYGIALAALGMTATYATTSACDATRELAALGKAARALPADLSIAETTATVSATLALLIAAAPVLAMESAHRGAALMLVATAAPALLIGVVAGAAGAQGLSRRFAAPEGEAAAVRQAAGAVAIAAGLPALAGASFGGSAAVGVALGFAAWAVASAPLATGEDLEGGSGARMRGSVLLAWGRTMALAALVGAPLMS